MNESLLKAVQDSMPEIIEIRREIHKHPELGRQEFHTTEIIKQKLAEYGVDEIQSLTETGAVAIIRGTEDSGFCIALRTDIDALPVTEETGLPYASETPGVMHACGHDMHCSMMLGVAKYLCSHRDEFKGTVKLIFQPSEDTMPGGARDLVEKGVMENPHVDAIVGMHVLPHDDVGVAQFHSGPVTTSCDIFTFNIKGKGGHGSTPHLTIDPILTSAQLIMNLQQIQSRYVNPLETVIFPICVINGGVVENIIPETAYLKGVARTYMKATRDRTVEQVYQIVKGVETMTGATIDVDHLVGYPACFNDYDLTSSSFTAVQEALGAEHSVIEPDPASFSEDFSYYTELTGTPGLFILLRAGHIGEKVSLHNPRCAMNEEAMPYGIATMITVATNYLNKKASDK